MAKLELQKLQVKNILHEISIEFSTKEIHAILGPNGTGKSTLFRSIIGAIKNTSGKILLDNENICHKSLEHRVKLGITYLPQGKSIFTGLTVKENLLAVQQMLPNANMKDIIDKFKLNEIIERKASNLSGGQTRRVEIARCALLKPKFLLLDEPFAGIDPKTINELKAILKTIPSDGTGIIITDHQAEKTMDLSDKTTILADGRVLISGDPRVIAKNHKVKSIYLGDG